MAYFYKAFESPRKFSFEVCPATGAPCPHTIPAQDHRTYTWGKPLLAPITVTDMVREIGLLEAEIAARDPPQVTLEVEGHLLAP